MITTVPNVSYHAYLKKDPDNIVIVNNPTDLPEPNYLDRVEEPYINAQVITSSIIRLARGQKIARGMSSAFSGLRFTLSTQF